MTTSPTPMIYVQMSNVMADIGAVSKSRENQAQRYKFRGVDDVFNAVHDAMAKHGVFCVPEVIKDHSEERKSRQDAVLIYRILTVRYTFFCEDGSSVSAVTIGEGMDSGDKASNKAMSGAHKYALLQIFCIETEEQKDSEYQTPEVKPAAPIINHLFNKNTDNHRSWLAKNCPSGVDLDLVATRMQGRKFSELKTILGAIE